MKSSAKKEFVFGSFVYHYDLVMQDRKSLSLSVAPDLQIILKCPHGVDTNRIENFLKRKWFWLEKQLTFFRKYQKKKYEKEYASGEELFYLGKQYRLVVEKSSDDRVVVGRGIFCVYTVGGVHNWWYTRRLIERWYEVRSEKIFNNRYKEVSQMFQYKVMPKIGIRTMPKRWGSFVESGKIILNPRLIYTSRDCIDYVIAHELCHVKYKKHNKHFFDFLSKKYPNWKKVKEKLEVAGVKTS